MTPRNEVRAHLATLGTPLDDDFNQTDRKQEANLAPGQVDEGFCRGVCTDWLRRVIQGGNPWYDPTAQRAGANKPQKTPEVAAAHRNQQTMRMATIQLSGGSKALPATTYQQRLRSSRAELAALYNANLQATELAVPADVLRRVHEFQVFPDRPRFSMGFIKQVLDGMRGMITAVDPEQSWSSLAGGMDTYLTEQRAEAGRHAPERLFSGIAAGISQIARQPYQGLGAAAEALIGIEGFHPGTGVIAGFRVDVPQGNAMVESGHAVAVFRHNNDLFYFFDPNYGVYRVNRAGVVGSIAYLFGQIYQEDGWQVLNANGFCSMRLSVFRRAN